LGRHLLRFAQSLASASGLQARARIYDAAAAHESSDLATSFRFAHALASAGVSGARDDRPGAAPVAIIADSLWRQRFAADPAIVGRIIMLDGAPVTVVSIMPRTFENVWSAEARI
jgi:hypothetical protein